MTTQSLQEKVEEIISRYTITDLARFETYVEYESAITNPINDLLSLFKQTVEEEIIGEDERGTWEPGVENTITYEEAHDISERNEFRASQRQKLQDIINLKK